jgi:S1-C subfamily serine protease
VGVDYGVIVETIEADSPAYKSQLRAADVIVEVDNVKVSAALDVQKEILKKKIGATVQLTVWRAGTVLQIPVATGELPTEYTKVANLRPGKLGVEPKAESLGLQLRDARPTGASVVAVAQGSAAQRAAMQAEDVITEVGGRTVRDAAAAAAAIGDRLRRARDKAVVLNIERKGMRTVVAITPD